jgi:CRISPR/Cas system Type II protein with McrA/HNH and RuvC-like nuclease domain
LTPRAVKPWVGRRPESMPGQIVLLRLYSKQDGKCACGCGMVMNLERDEIDVDHVVPLIDGGENVESNLQLLLREHHRTKTKAEATARSYERQHKAKAFRHMDKPSFQTNRTGKFKKRMNGEVVLRATEGHTNDDH